MATAPPPGFVAIYRFRVDPAREDDFVDAWARMTELIKNERGGLGSRLHRGDDGVLYAYAEWPDRDSWAAEWTPPAEAARLRAVMSDATVERLDTILLTPVRDLLVRTAEAREEGV